MGLFGVFSNKDTANEIKRYLEKGALVLDVRTKKEWEEGHSKNAKHLVLTTIPLHLEEIKSWEKPVITVCRSGGRSHQAAQYLSNQGIDVINGGPWQNVDQYF